MIHTCLGAILFGAFAQPELANMYTIGGVPPAQHHPKISCSESGSYDSGPAYCADDLFERIGEMRICRTRCRALNGILREKAIYI